MCMVHHPSVSACLCSRWRRCYSQLDSAVRARKGLQVQKDAVGVSDSETRRLGKAMNARTQQIDKLLRLIDLWRKHGGLETPALTQEEVGGSVTLYIERTN
jgi:hypothetical protein